MFLFFFTYYFKSFLDGFALTTGGNYAFLIIANLFVEDPYAILTRRNSGSKVVTFLPPTTKDGYASLALNILKITIY